MVALLAFVFTIGFILFFRRIAPSVGLLGHPGAHRRHTSPTPLVGGIAMFAAIALALVVSGGWKEVDMMLAGGLTLLVLTGIADDRWETPFWLRFISQVVAAWLMATIGGVVLRDLGFLVSDKLLILGGWSVPITVFAVVGVINATNMVDGLDGLAGLLVLVAISGLIVLSMIHAGDSQAGWLALSGAAVIAFLIFNVRWFGRNHAAIFMGDAGSMILGFVLAWHFVEMSQGVDRSIYPVTALWLLALPLFDAVGVLLRRALRGKSPFSADRIHTHHLLQDFGFSTNDTLLIMFIGAIILAAGGILADVNRVPERVMFYLFLLLFCLYLLLMERGGARVRSQKAAPSRSIQ